MVDGISWDELLDQAGDDVVDSFEPLPNDDYEVEVVEATFTMTKSVPSKKMWKVHLKVINHQKFNNRRVWTNIVLSPDNSKALGFFFRNMAVLGLTREYFATKPTDEAIAAAMKGRRARVKIIQKPYQGDMQNEVDRFIAPLAFEGAPTGVSAAPAAPAPSGVPAPPIPGAVAPPAAAPTPAPTAPSPQAGVVPPAPPLGDIPF